MHSPRQPSQPLIPHYTDEGVEVDYCPGSRGIWFDRGELFYFCRDTRTLEHDLAEAVRAGQPGGLRSPRANAPMLLCALEGGIPFHWCPQTHGIWMDGDALEAFRATGQFHLTLDALGQVSPESRDTPLTADEAYEQAGASDRRSGSIMPDSRAFGIHQDSRAFGIHQDSRAFGIHQDSRAFGTTDSRAFGIHQDSRAFGTTDSRAFGTTLAPLPNLFLRSTIMLSGMYLVLGLALITAVEFAGLSANAALLIVVGMTILQFIFSPWIMDITLRWLYRMRWAEFTELPAHLQAFVTRVSLEHRIRTPRFGIIRDGAPQAFTYGHSPSNARIVLSRGTLDLLDEKELEAVVAHEMGHAIHWDMFLMTAAQLVPTLLYYIYRLFWDMARKGRGGGKKGGHVTIFIAAGAYVLYILAHYVVLAFSRTREYHADRFAGETTKNPGALASALVKIAYGLASREDVVEENKNAHLASFESLGIFDRRTARQLAISAYGTDIQEGGDWKKDPGHIKGAMRWDLWNPWARWYEFHSTHPLTAKRLQHLADLARHLHQPPFIEFNESQPESYWDEFLFDLFVAALPWAVLLWGGVMWAAADPNQPPPPMTLALTLFLYGLALFHLYLFIYPTKHFPEMSIAALLKKVKVSGTRPIPCQLTGTIIGKGIPGYIASEDFVMQDDTGIIFLDYQQPLALWEFLFGLLKADTCLGKQVRLTGWYHRAPVPFVRIRRFTIDEHTRTSWVPGLKYATAALISFAGLCLLFQELIR